MTNCKVFFSVLLLLCSNLKGFTRTNDTLYQQHFFVLQKNDCPTLRFGKESFEYTVRTKIYNDTIGRKLPQTIKDTLLLKDTLQRLTNQRGTCMLMYVNEQIDTLVRKNNCGTDSFGLTYLYTVPSQKYVDLLAQETVNQRAHKELQDSAQVKANKYGFCKAYFYNTEISQTTQKQCGKDSVGRKYTYLVRAKKYKDTLAQSLVDARAQRDAQDSAQLYAQQAGVCKILFKYYVRDTVFVRRRPCVKQIIVKQNFGKALTSFYEEKVCLCPPNAPLPTKSP